MQEYTIVPATAEDVARVPVIELAAARLLRGHAPDAVLRETSDEAELMDALRDGRLWVARADGLAVGYAHVMPIDAVTAHLEEVDVLPEHGQRGLGTKLVLQVCQWARANGYARVTLTTFRDVPWNMPFYQKLGFTVVPPGQLDAPLSSRVANEAARGLDPLRRVVMSRHLRA